VAFSCPENININSQSKVSIDDYYLSGTGDSSIVYATDWHNTGTSWTQSGQTSADAPFKCTLGAGYIDTTLGAAVALDSTVHGFVMTGGHEIQNYAMGADASNFANNAIAVSNTFNSSDAYAKIGPGIIDNTAEFGQGGVFGQGGYDDGTQAKFLEISPQIYLGSYPRGREVMPSNTGATGLSIGIRLRERNRRFWPTQPDILTSFGNGTQPANANGFTFTIDAGTVGVTQSDSGVKGANGLHLWSARSLQTIRAGQLNILPTNETATQSICSSSIVSVRFMAISQGSPTTSTASYLIITATFAGAVTGSYTFPILNTTWKQLEFTASMLGALFLSSISFGSPAVTGLVANIEELDLGMYDAI
jgi:hypothetical protein